VPEMISFAEALVAALADAMEDDRTVNVLGQSLGLGPQRSYMNRLIERFEDRVVDLPISEAVVAAIGAGAAMAGVRPFVNLSTGSFAYLAWSQIINEAAVTSYMTAGKLACPVVYHCLEGARGGGAPQHSHVIHGQAWNKAGLQILVPSTAADVYGLTRAALASRNPSFLMTHERLMPLKGMPPADSKALPFGVAEVKRPGRHVTIVAISIMVHAALAAAETLAKDGVDAEVLDPRTLVPFDEETILESVGRTGRLVVADEGPLLGGAASGIAGMVAERGFHLLKAPIQRVARPNTHVPFSWPMENFLLPNSDTIVAAVRHTLDQGGH
jgi:pyruvate/2-oxoglutarate/acetoin dehydrogenase E1 component